MERGKIRARLLREGVLGGAMLLAACSGGGGGGGIGSTPPPVSTPTPTPTPVPTPTPTPSVNYDTAEYRASQGPVSMNALTAYQHGAIGSGVKVGVIDSGIDLQSGEFGACASSVGGTGACRIDPASADVAGNGTIDDVGGHGTAVAFTLAGRRNDVATQGVAFDATLIVLRTDSPGSCADIQNGQPQCSHEDSAIAQALDIARTNGAKVVNISLGGDPAGAVVLAAVQRATQAGMVVVISAGNDGDKPLGANPDPFASTSAGAADTAHGGVIIAGSVSGPDGGDAGTAPGTISSFSNRAGTGASIYLAAVGEHVRAPDQNNAAFYWSGTSFSAPQIAGAAALLAQAFPNLTGAQIIDILFTSARDAGAPGTDAVYGRGILDLTRAFQPLGATSLAGSRAPASLTANGMLSAPMGDAAQSGLGAVVLDGFDRAYALDLARTINRQGPARRLAGLLASRERGFAAGVKDLTVAVTIAPRAGGMSVERMTLGQAAAGQARAIAASIMGRLGSHAQFAFGASESGTVLAARLAGRREPAFLVARDPAASAGFDSVIGASMAVRQRLGGWGVTAAAENGAVLSPRESQFATLRGESDRYGYGRFTLALDGTLGGLRAGLALTRLAESDTILGAHFSGALGAPRASTLFVDLAGRWEMGAGWSLGGSMRQGWTFARLRGGVEGSGLVRTSGFAADVGKVGLFGAGDRAGLRIAQPLRVASGGLDLRLPASWDYDMMGVDAWSIQRLNFAPTGREVDFEASYATPFRAGDLTANLFLRRDPGNFAAMPDDAGAALRFSMGF